MPGESNLSSTSKLQRHGQSQQNLGGKQAQLDEQQKAFEAYNN